MISTLIFQLALILHKLITIPANLSKLSNIVDYNFVKKLCSISWLSKSMLLILRYQVLKDKSLLIHNAKIAEKFEENYLKQKEICFCLIIIIVSTVKRFKLGDCLLWAVKLTKNADPGKYGSSGYDSGFDSRSIFIFFNNDFAKYVVILGVENSLSLHTDERKKIS